MARFHRIKKRYSKRKNKLTLSLVGIILIIILIPAIVFVIVSKNKNKNVRAAEPCLTWAGQCSFVSSIDTMKLSKDMDTGSLSDAQIDAAVTAAAALNPTHITVVTHYDYPNLMYRWVKSIRAHGRKVWFRPGIKGWGSGTFSPTQWMSTYQNFLNTYVGNPSYPNFFVKGDIFDPNAETENGYVVWCGCSLYSDPYKTNFNQFLIDQTSAADKIFASKGFTQGTTNSGRDILTTVHSVDPGTSTGVLSSTYMSAMDNLVVVDAYPDQNETDPAIAASKWINQLSSLHSKWPSANILLGEIGYSNTMNVSDSQQKAVVAAEMAAFSSTTYPMVGMNYWVGPGSSGSGGYTYILTGSVSSGWTPRPAANCLSAFYIQRSGRSASLCPTGSPSPSPAGTPSSLSTNIWCEAENGSLVSPMVKGSDTNASNGAYIYSTVTNTTNVPPSNTGLATRTINVPVSGTYILWTRMNYASDTANSYSVQLDGGSYFKVGNENAGYGVWKWVDWQNGDVSGTSSVIKVTLSAGSHALKIYGREANTKIDKILLTTDPSFVPSGNGNTDNCSDGLTVSTTPSYIWCEAENGSLVSPMVKGSDTNASNSTFIFSTVADTSAVPPPNTGSNLLTVNIPASGTYILWTRMNYGSDTQNSYWVQFDGGNLFKVGNENSTYKVWKWVNWQNGENGTKNPIKIDLSGGTHNLKIYGREANTKIDKVLLTTNSTFAPSGSGSQDNCH